jgi:hypothetical protein
MLDLNTRRVKDIRARNSGCEEALDSLAVFQLMMIAAVYVSKEASPVNGCIAGLYAGFDLGDNMERAGQASGPVGNIPIA